MASGIYEIPTVRLNGLGEVKSRGTQEREYVCSRRGHLVEAMKVCDKCGNSIGLDDMVYINAHEVYCSYNCMLEHSKIGA